MTAEQQQLIDRFLAQAEQSYGTLPRFAWNQGAFNRKVFYSGPVFDRQELAAAIGALLFGQWFSSGEHVHRFEREFSRVFRAGHSVMVNSGSSANLAMIAALKKHFRWHDGDEVILPVVGFPTTLGPLVQNHLKPVFADIEFDTLNFDLAHVAQQITPRTRAILISPVLGNPPDFDVLLALKERHGVELILDGCDSLGSQWRGRYLNEYAVASSCSFYPAHHITTGEGGMVSSGSEQIIKLARSIAWWGRDCYCMGKANLLPDGTCGARFHKWIESLDVVIDHKYYFTNVGYNLKPLDLQGAIGLAQLSKVAEFHAKRNHHKQAIERIFHAHLPGLQPVHTSEHAEVSWFGVPLVCREEPLKRALVQHLEDNGIQTRNYFAGNVLLHPAYASLGDWRAYPNADQVLQRVFFVGCSPAYTPEMLDYIREIVQQFRP